MARTLLDYVNDILSDLGEDPVNSISDTFVSEQVAQIVRSTYESLMSGRNWAHLRKPLQLTASGDTNIPTHMSIENDVKELILINYDVALSTDNKKVYREIKYKQPDEFLRLTNHRDSSQTRVDVVTDATGIELLINNDEPPTYYTSFDDETLVFDSYDVDVDDTLQASKVQSLAYVAPSWNHNDNHLPDLPLDNEPELLAESKVKCSWYINQEQDLKAEQEAQKLSAWSARKNRRIAGGVRYPNYGRRSLK
jgi:hypothetical protein